MDTFVIRRIAQFLDVTDLSSLATVNKGVFLSISESPELWKDRWIFYMDPCDDRIRDTFEGFLNLCDMWRSIRWRIMHEDIYINKEVGVYAEVNTVYGFIRKILLPFIEKDYCTKHAKDRDDGLRMAYLDHIALVHFKPPENPSNIVLFGDTSREYVKITRHQVPMDDRSEIIRYIIREVSIKGLPPSHQDMENHMRFIMIDRALKPTRDFWDKANHWAAILGAQYGYGTREWNDAMRNASYHLR